MNNFCLKHFLVTRLSVYKSHLNPFSCCLENWGHIYICTHVHNGQKQKLIYWVYIKMNVWYTGTLYKLIIYSKWALFNISIFCIIII